MILDRGQKEEPNSYLNREFRNLLRAYGVDYDLPFLYRPIGHAFRRTLLRRAAVDVTSDPVRHRFLVIDTDSLMTNVRSGVTLPHDPDTADICLWPVEKTRKNVSEEPWCLKPEDQPDLLETGFTITLKKIGAK